MTSLWNVRGRHVLNRRRTVGLLGSAFAAATLPKRAIAGTKIQVGYLPVVSCTPLYLAAAQPWAGTDLEVEPLRLQAGPAIGARNSKRQHPCGRNRLHCRSQSCRFARHPNHCSDERQRNYARASIQPNHGATGLNVALRRGPQREDCGGTRDRHDRSSGALGGSSRRKSDCWRR